MKAAAAQMVRPLCAGLIIGAGTVSADTVVFTKPDSADWTLPENQDRITDNVWITRKNIQSLFNIAQEDGFSDTSNSPMGTLWAHTTTAAADPASYTNFVAMHGGGPQSIIGDTVSLYLPQDELYFDVTFLSYSGGNTGGGFSYSRTSIGLGVDKTTTPKEFFVSKNYPNPFNPTTIFNYALTEMAQVKVRVIDMTGKIVQEYRQGAKQTGRHKFILDGSNIASGEYICLFSAGTLQTSRKVTLLK
jgi:hypothetical protein